MAFLFFIFALAIAFIAFGYRKTAMALVIINLLLCLAMFWHHITDHLKINL